MFEFNLILVEISFLLVLMAMVMYDQEFQIKGNDI